MKYRNKKEIAISLAAFTAVFFGLSYALSEPLSFLNFLIENPSEITSDMIEKYTLLNTMLLLTGFFFIGIIYGGNSAAHLSIHIYRKIQGMQKVKRWMLWPAFKTLFIYVEVPEEEDKVLEDLEEVKEYHFNEDYTWREVFLFNALILAYFGILLPGKMTGQIEGGRSSK